MKEKIMNNNSVKIRRQFDKTSLFNHRYD